MSILITGVEMPTNTYLALNIYPDGRVAMNLDADCTTAISVSTPHGRLGDLDELEKSFREDADTEWNRFASPVNWADAFDDVANIVADAPTIIPASTEGE